MTKDEAVHNLTLALADTIGTDPSVNAAVAAFDRIGLKITNITLQIAVEAESMEQLATAGADLEFLRAVGIAPELEGQGRGEQ